MDEEVNRDENDEAVGMNLEVDSKDEVMHITHCNTPTSNN